jgi:DnaJ-class molecular chaperone
MPLTHEFHELLQMLCPMNNLPPGVTSKDIDPPVCPRCEGSGDIFYTINDPLRGLVEVHETCPDCAGLGTPNERVKD